MKSNIFRLFPLACLFLATTTFLVACANHPKNPSFPITSKEGKRALQEMSLDPAPMASPLLILNGIFDPGICARNVKNKIGPTISGRPIIVVQFTTCTHFDQCRERVFKHVQNALPQWRGKGPTPELDVVGISMGGLVARYSALPQEDLDSPRLNIHQLFTLSTPHRGAKLADNLSKVLGVGVPFGLYQNLQPQSSVVREVHLDNRTYPIYPYVRLRDKIVGDSHAAPFGQTPWWVPGKIKPEASHLVGTRDARILADIARKLRGEPSYTKQPAAPLPEL